MPYGSGDRDCAVSGENAAGRARAEGEKPSKSDQTFLPVDIVGKWREFFAKFACQIFNNDLLDRFYRTAPNGVLFKLNSENFKLNDLNPRIS